MTEYILSIVSVILLTGAVGIILPEGKTGKFIKSVFAVATLVVILTPLINLKGQEVPAFGGNDDVVYDEGYFDYIDYEKSESMSDTLEKILKDEGYESLVQVYYERVDNKFKVTKVLIFLQNPGISGQDEHIYIPSEIIQAVASYCGIGEDKVIVNEVSSKAEK
ncbi:MAG: hypothetical protein ACLUHK_06545 [Eubacteriales bacterium]